MGYRAGRPAPGSKKRRTHGFLAPHLPRQPKPSRSCPPPPEIAGLFFVRQDGMWLHSGNAGKDIQFDDDGRSYVSRTGTRASTT